MAWLVVTAAAAETRALGSLEDARVVEGGIGRVNAAVATAETVLRHGPFAGILSAGLAGRLPGGGLRIGDAVVASRCIYAEEGLVTPGGFADIAAMGFSLGDFEGNAVPVDERMLETLAAVFPVGPIATVATCSGTDAAARTIADRTGAIAEAMEGAAVVHAARRLGVPAIELRVISNTTGDRAGQQWDLPGSLETLRHAVQRAVESLRASDL